MTRKNPVRYWEASIGSSKKLNDDLRYIKEHAKTGSYREIIEQVIKPLAKLLRSKKAPSSYLVYTTKDQVIIQTYGGWDDIVVSSGKLTAPLNETLGVDFQ